MLQLNDFSGGLNTKSSPRDINVNQLTLADNAIVSKAGLIQSSKDAEDKSSATDLNHATNHGNGAFLFTSQFDINNTDALVQGETPADGNRVDETAREIIAYPDSQNIKFFYFHSFVLTKNFFLKKIYQLILHISFLGNQNFLKIYNYCLQYLI